MVGAACAFDEAGPEDVAGIDRALLAPRADAQRNATLGAMSVPPSRRLVRFPRGRGHRHGMVRIAVRHDRLGKRRRMPVEYPRQVLAVRADPAGHGARAWSGIETAGMAQDRRGKTPIHHAHAPQQPPGRRLADGQVWIVGGPLLARGRQRHRGHEPHGDKIEEKVHLLLAQRIFGVEPGNQPGRVTDRILGIEDGIGAGDGDLGDQHTVQGVAEVDQSGDAFRLCRIDKHVPVIGVVVDHLRPQCGQPWRHLGIEVIDEPGQQGTIPFFVDVVQARARATRLMNVPVERPQRAGMDEPLQGMVEPAKRAAEAFKQARCGLALGERLAGKPRHQAQGMVFAAGAGDMGKRRASHRFPEAWHGEARRVLREMVEQRCLEFALAGRLAGVDDLQDPERPVRGSQLEILVALAVEWRDVAGKAEVPGGKLDGFAG